MTEAETLILKTIDNVHERINDIHNRIDDLTKGFIAVEVKVTELVGNGQPGKIRQMEEDIAAHSKFMWILLGLLSAGSLSEFVAHGSHLLKMLFE